MTVLPFSRRRLAAPILALVLATPLAASGEPGWEAVEVAALPVALDPHWPERQMVGHLQIEAGFELRARDPRFGGLSGLVVEPDGLRLIAVGDRGQLWRASPQHDEWGRLVGIGDWATARLVHQPFEPEGLNLDDAEAITPLAGGGLAIAFEQHHRLRRLPPGPPGTPLEALPAPGELAQAPANEGIEALATLADGSLLALCEGLFVAPGLLRGWRVAGEDFLPLAYRPRAGFRPTAADRLGPHLFVLERSLGLLAGWQARIVVVPESAIVRDAVLEGVELARLHAPLAVDNFEGLAAREGPGGRVLLYLLSDDNFLPLQRNLLLQLSIDRAALDALATGG